MRSFLYALIAFIFVSPSTFAQEIQSQGHPQIGGEGRLLIVRVVPGDKTAKLFFAGKKAAEIDFKKDHKVLSITALSDGMSEELHFKSTGDAYEVYGTPNKPYDLNVKSEVRGKVETIKVNISPAKP